jgi:hypothetical protein
VESGRIRSDSDQYQLAAAAYADHVDRESYQSLEDPQQLARTAEQLEQLARFVSRPDSRTHIFERAAECLAKAALIRAARGPAAEQL